MPHIIIELSDNLAQNAPFIVERIQQSAVSCGLFDSASVKTRAQIYQHFVLGNHSDSFIHVQAKILSGRTDQQKQDLSDCLIDCLHHHWPKTGCLSVEIIDMDKNSYRKQQQ